MTEYPPRVSYAESDAGAGGAGGAQAFVDNGGPVLQNARIQLVFWGRAWASTPTPSAGQVIDAVDKICAGPYLWGLSEYRNIQPAVLAGAQIVTTSDPPNPFSDADVQTLISNLVTTGRLPAPATDSQLLYMVIMPNGVGAGGGFIGEHSYFSLSGSNAHYAWVMNNGTLDYVTSILSHELVEACTDPEGTAITGTAGTCSQGGWCEIGDVCYQWGTVDGVRVQYYWSQRNGGCILSDQKYVTDNKGAKDTKDGKDAKEHKDPKDHKDGKDHKDHKELKDAKDGKFEHKELKDGAKEKDQDLPVQGPATPFGPANVQGGGVVPGMTPFGMTSGPGSGGGVARTFVEPDERPAVGESATKRRSRRS